MVKESLKEYCQDLNSVSFVPISFLCFVLWALVEKLCCICAVIQREQNICIFSFRNKKRRLCP